MSRYRMDEIEDFDSTSLNITCPNPQTPSNFSSLLYSTLSACSLCTNMTPPDPAITTARYTYRIS